MTRVRDERGSVKAVSRQKLVVDLELSDGIFPLLSARSKGVDEAVRETELDVEPLLLVDGAVLFSLGFVELTLEIGHERV